jgi:uncharacterized protein YndB with AHSA1/START domain
MYEGHAATSLEAAPEELVLTRVIHASRRRVFDAWTKPDQLALWWGPDGFTLVTCEVDLRLGGSLHFVMRGPEGVEYPFDGHVLEVIPPARFIFTADLGGDAGNLLLTAVTFDDHDDGTRLTVVQTIPRTEAYARGQRRGWIESLERLALFLAPS